jgi:hypothetical protein
MKRFLLALPALALLLTGCGMSERLSNSMFGTPTEKDIERMPDCPQTGVLADATFIPVFTGNGINDVAALGKLGGITGGCSFAKPGIAAMDIKITFLARKVKPELDIKKQAFPYFIAILSPDQQILQRQNFSTKVDFDNTGYGVMVEEHELKIPVPSREAAEGYKVVVGYELSPDQLTYNRKKEDKNAD